MAKQAAPPDPIEPSKAHHILVKKEVKCGETQCGDCRERATYYDTCLEFNRSLKRSRVGRVLRCRACLEADVKGGRR